MIILENYEANVGWFPVIWNTKSMLQILLSDKCSISGIHWVSNSASNKIKQIDYVFLYGNQRKISNPEWSELNEQLKKGFTLKYQSLDNYVKLYRRM